MSLPEFFISFDVPGGPWEPTTNMLSLTISAGRQAALDTYGAATAEVVFRRVSANTADLDKITPGTIVTINDVDLYGAGNLLKVTDVINQYGITSNADICVITMEGALAEANRAYLNNYNLGADVLSDQITEIATESGVNMGTSTLNNPQCDGTTVTSVADWLQKLVTTINGFIDDTNEIFVYDRFSSGGYDDIFTGDQLVFSDGTVALVSGQVKISYDQMTFSSLGENYYTRVIIDPDNHAAQVSTLATASAPYRVLQLDTFNSSTGQAQDYADFLLSTYSDPTHRRISSVSVLGQSPNAELLFRNLGGYATARTVEIIFRGTTYDAVIEGWVVSMTPGESRYTFYFSGADLNNYLILNDTDRGVLDANRLGY